MNFECPKCGWGVEGGDETGLSILNQDGEPNYDEWFDYCFHCGEKLGCDSDE